MVNHSRGEFSPDEITPQPGRRSDLIANCLRFGGRRVRHSCRNAEFMAVLFAHNEAREEVLSPDNDADPVLGLS